MSETALTPSPSHPPPLRAIPRLIARVRARLAVPRFVDPINDTPDAEIAAGRLVQQRSTTGRLYARVGLIRCVVGFGCRAGERGADEGTRGRLFLVLGGLGWLLALPLEQLGRRTFVDEHAIQPGQVSSLKAAHRNLVLNAWLFPSRSDSIPLPFGNPRRSPPPGAGATCTRPTSTSVTWSGYGSGMRRPKSGWTARN